MASPAPCPVVARPVGAVAQQQPAAGRAVREQQWFWARTDRVIDTRCPFHYTRTCKPWEGICSCDVLMPGPFLLRRHRPSAVQGGLGHFTRKEMWLCQRGPTRSSRYV